MIDLRGHIVTYIISWISQFARRIPYFFPPPFIDLLPHRRPASPVDPLLLVAASIESAKVCCGTAASVSLRRAGTLPSSDDLRLPFGALDCAALRRSVRENGCP